MEYVRGKIRLLDVVCLIQISLDPLVVFLVIGDLGIENLLP